MRHQLPTLLPDPTRDVPPAMLYLASADDAQAALREVAGRPVAFRVVMTALRAGCPSVALPGVFRGTALDHAIQGSPRARARTVWLDDREGHPIPERAVLLPSALVLAPDMLQALLEASPVAVLSAAPAGAPGVLAERH